MSEKEIKRVIALIILIVTVTTSSLFYTFSLNASQRIHLPDSVFRRAHVRPDILMLRVQEWRISKGYKPFKYDASLCEIADQRVDESITDWSHDGFRRKSQMWMDHYNIAVLGENLSKDFWFEDETLDAWLKSDEHRMNLEFGYTDSCISCKQDHCAQIFAKYANK